MMRATLRWAVSGVVAAVMAIPASADDKPDAGWATITGKVVWGKDEIPGGKLDVPDTNADKKYCLEKGSIPDETITVDATTKAVANVFVYLKKADKIHPSFPQTKDDVKAADAEFFKKENGFAYAEAEEALKGGKTTVEKLKASVILDQPYCRFTPHALALREGQKLLVKNPDTCPHNANIAGFASENPQNLAMPPKTIRVIDLVSEPGVIPVECNIHGWMKAGIMVHQHPYFAVTGKDGKFVIKNVPPGELTLVVRNADGQYVNRSLKVTAEADKVAELEVKWVKK